MKRRDFIKLSLVAGSAILLPNFTYAANLDVSQISFSSGNYTTNNAQTIMIFMYGGASQLAGNITNIDEIERKFDDNESFSALAFKVATDPFVGKLIFTRVYAGTLKSGSYIYNATT